jgi:hypothetical protein
VLRQHGKDQTARLFIPDLARIGVRHGDYDGWACCSVAVSKVTVVPPSRSQFRCDLT